ncbi:hypothetical protein Q0M94_15340 [Deinococcus radiomollis]|uniref:hypothetical protein n=1 Tax=Deinococcus radiomollis TaxID=468916 RepID=UPI0038924D57
MNRTLLALLLAATTSCSCTLAQSGPTGAGLAISGTVSGSVPAQARVGGFVIDSSGNPVAELVSVAVTGGRFGLELPSVTPPGGALSTLRPASIFWPGLLEPVSVSGQASTADLKFYVYNDSNGNGRRDDTEPLQETVAFVGKSLLVVSYATGAAQVNAARGFQVNLKPGWNGLLIEVGKVVRVSSSNSIGGVTLNVQR